MTELITAKVARILNNTDLALNRGTDVGVEIGMKFAILSDAGADITDPDTGEVLDSVEIAKTLVKIISVTERLSVGRTFRRYESAGIADMFTRGSSRHETLNSDESRVQQELDPRKSKVKVGDEAVQYTGDFAGIVYDF